MHLIYRRLILQIKENVILFQHNLTILNIAATKNSNALQSNVCWIVGNSSNNICILA